MKKDEFLRVAKDYRARGFSVIPVTYHGKTPALERWEEYQSRHATDAELEAWANSAEELNIGIVTGQISDIVVIDIDGKEGIASYGELAPKKNETLTSATGKGLHLLVKYPSLPLGNKVGVWGKDSHVDIRANGGYIVAPPSIHASGADYQWLTPLDTELAQCPDWLIQLSYPNYNKAPVNIQPEKSGKSVEIIEEGRRNDTLYRLACVLRHKKLAKSAILAAVYQHNLECCASALTYEEVEKLVESAFKKEGTPIRPLTDIGNAERMVDRYAGVLRYSISHGKWITFDGKCWEIDHGAQVIDFVTELVRSIPFEADPDDADMVKEFRKFGKSCETHSRVNSLLKLSEKKLGAKADMFDKSPYDLNLKNGTINLKTMEFRQHKAEDFITKMGNVTYDPEAQCIAWKTFLNEIFNGNANLIRYVQKAVGYSLTGDTREQVFFTLHGSGANGKSTFIDIIQTILGSYGVKTDFATFLAKSGTGVPNDVARLAGSRFITASESGLGKLLDDSLLKDFTGGENITARYLFQEFFEFKPQGKIWLITNHKPIIRDDSEGMWRRIKLIPFEVTIPKEKRDKTLPRKLQEELSGILNWALEGAKLWFAEGLGEVDEVDKATNEYKLSMDIFGKFLEDCVEVDTLAVIKSSDLYEAYKVWATANNERPWSQMTFSIKMAEKGFQKKKERSGNIWLGLRLGGEY